GTGVGGLGPGPGRGNREPGRAGRVRVALTGAGGGFEVGVPTPAAGDGGMEWPPQPATDGQDPAALPAELGLAVIAGLADDVQVSRNGDGLSIRMSWPSGAPGGLPPGYPQAERPPRADGRSGGCPGR